MKQYFEIDFNLQKTETVNSLTNVSAIRSDFFEIFFFSKLTDISFFPLFYKYAHNTDVIPEQTIMSKISLVSADIHSGKICILYIGG